MGLANALMISLLVLQPVAGQAELLRSFQDMEKHYNRSLFFPADETCWPLRDDQGRETCSGGKHKTVWPVSPHKWRYLNSGLIVGLGARCPTFFVFCFLWVVLEEWMFTIIFVSLYLLVIQKPYGWSLVHTTSSTNDHVWCYRPSC